MMDRQAIRELTRKAIESATSAPSDKMVLDAVVADLILNSSGAGPSEEIDAADTEAFIGAIVRHLMPEVDRRIEAAIAAAKGSVDQYLLNRNPEGV